MSEDTIYQRLIKAGMSRRDFIKFCGVVASTIGLQSVSPVMASGLPDHLEKPNANTAAVAHALKTNPRVPVIWLEFQDCAGCSEA
ncbi:MAG TPA: twin-arginine translocation signal domain-containing protein, partial [Anaerolineaceae bacterium]